VLTAKLHKYDPDRTKHTTGNKMNPTRSVAMNKAYKFSLTNVIDKSMNIYDTKSILVDSL
jgi:hypothetical protein